MPRGEHPNSRANLIRNSERTPDQRKKQAQKAGRASGEARAVYKSLTEDLRERCTPDRVAKMNDRIISMAEHGNLRAYEIIRDGLGENPKNGTIDTEMLNRAKEILGGIDCAID